MVRGGGENKLGCQPGRYRIRERECRALEAETGRRSPAWLDLFFSIPNLAGNGLAVQLGGRSDLPLWHPHTRFLSSETPRLVGPLDVDVLVTGYCRVRPVYYRPCPGSLTMPSLSEWCSLHKCRENKELGSYTPHLIYAKLFHCTANRTKTSWRGATLCIRYYHAGTSYIVHESPKNCGYTHSTQNHKKP